MKRSARFMALGIGLILAGILGMMFGSDPNVGTGGQAFVYQAQILPLLGSVAGPILLIVGFFVKDK